MVHILWYTYHQTERQREPDAYGWRYRWRYPRLGWTCALCHQWWTKAPRSYCPGVPAYYSWTTAQAAGLRTQTQWKAERRKVLADAKPRGAMMRGPAHPNDWYDLFIEEQTVPMRAAPVKAAEEAREEA